MLTIRRVVRAVRGCATLERAPLQDGPNEPMMIMVMDMSMHAGMSMMVIVACRLLRDFRYGFASQTCLYQPTKEVGELSDVLVDACLLQ